MKFTSKLACIGFLAASCSAYSATPTEGWYAGLMGGFSYMSDLHLTSPNPWYRRPDGYAETLTVPVIQSRLDVLYSFLSLQPPSINNAIYLNNIRNLRNLLPYIIPFKKGSASHGLGGDFAVQAGYRVCNFRLEGELLFNYAPISVVKVNGVTFSQHVTFRNPIRINGQTGFGAGLFNAYYDFYNEENDPSWVPYLGLGVGYAYTRTSINFSVPYLFPTLPNYPNLSSYSVSYNTKVNKSSPMGQGIVGISYYYSDDLALFMDYRYITTNRISQLGNRISTNTLNFGFNYSFE